MPPIDPGRPLPLISFETIMGEPLPPIAWLVEPLIATGDRLVLYGEFGSMKSWLLLDLALHLAAGRPWLGKFPIPEPKRVLYIDEEMNQRTLRRRMKRLAMGAGLEAHNLPLQALSRVGVRFNNSDAADALLKALEQSHFAPDVVIVEALRRVLKGSEIEAWHVGAFWRAVQPILAAGKTLIISHHMRKPNAQGNNASRDRASGSTDILAGADTAFAIQKLTKDSVMVEGIKSRETEEESPFVVSLYDEDKDGPVELRYEGSHKEFQETGTKLDQAMALVETFLRASGPPHIAERTVILAHLKSQGIKERTAERALEKLKKAKRVVQAGHGSWQLVTESDAS